MKSKKGFYPLFTTLGLVMVVMVLAITIQWNAKSVRAYDDHIDRLSWLKVNHAVDNVRSLASESLGDLFYEAIVDIGEIEEGTINPYLEYGKDEGWEQIVSDLRENVAADFTDSLSKLADYSDGHQNVFIFDEGINVTIGEITAADLNIVEAEDKILAVVELPMTATNRYQGWEATLFENNITIPLNVRLKDMYKRAWEFNNAYGETVRWTFTGAIYARAYYAAYLSSSGPFLKEAHYDFDPIATLMFGDLDTIKAFSKDLDSVLDIGAIPAATWMMEWQHLSEPSFLPAGFDMGAADKEKAKNAITNSYRMGELEDDACDEFSGEQLAACESIYNPEKLGEQVDQLYEEKEKYEDILDEVNDWLSDYDTTKYDKCGKKDDCGDDYDDCRDDADDDEEKDECREEYNVCKDRYGGYENDFSGDDKVAYCRYKELNKIFGGSSDDVCDDFRERATEVITAIVEGFDDDNAQMCLEDISDGRDYARDADTEGKIEQNFKKNSDKYGFDQVDDYCSSTKSAVSNLKRMLTRGLTESQLADSLCLNSRNKGDCITNQECGDAGDCDTSCSFLRCSDGSYYECIGDLETGKTEKETCSEGKDYIDECTCRCMPSIGLLKDINKQFKSLKGYLEKTYGALESSYKDLNKQLTARKNVDELAQMADGLDTNELGYDVFSRIRPGLVQYDKGEGLGGKRCYFKPTFADRNKGVCGDAIESTITYTIQIAAAALASVLSGGAATPLLEYAKNFFPMIFETRVEYTLTETLIDDGNRIILTNIAEPGAELYTYAPFEFQIYRNRAFSMDSATLGRTIVYIYLPAVRLDRVMEGLTSTTCTAESCDE